MSAKTVVKSLIEEIGFARFDGGSLRDGGRKQQPGSPICNTPMTMERARQIFDSIKDWSTSHKRYLTRPVECPHELAAISSRVRRSSLPSP
jgi:hypothetical protein